MVCLLCIASGSIFYTTLVGTLTAFAANKTASARVFTEKVESLEEFMQANLLANDLRSDIRQHFASSFSDRVYYRDGTLLADLDGPLRQRVVESRVASVLRQSVPCFAKGSAELMKAVALAMDSRYYLPGVWVYLFMYMYRYISLLMRILLTI